MTMQQVVDHPQVKSYWAEPVLVQFIGGRAEPGFVDALLAGRHAAFDMARNPFVVLSVLLPSHMPPVQGPVRQELNELMRDDQRRGLWSVLWVYSQGFGASAVLSTAASLANDTGKHIEAARTRVDVERCVVDALRRCRNMSAEAKVPALLDEVEQLAQSLVPVV